MNIRDRVVTLLLRLYPSAWRSEYGPELTDMLLTRPLGANIIADVLLSGLRERVRSVEPSTVMGLIVMLVILSGVLWNIAAPQPYGHASTELLQPSTKTLPTITVRPLASEAYLLFLMGFACWINLRRGGKVSQSGVAAMRICFIAGLPIMLAGILMGFGVLSLVVLGPGDVPTTFHEHGLTYTYYSAHPNSPAPLSVIASPLFRLPESWIWGTLGGWLGHRISAFRQSPPTGF
ncbi:MAG: hypothetical protein WC815_17390 [Vicinamibacterales bacterium]|jgi:hypothetical protein